MKPSTTETLFLSDLPSPRDEQFRMRRLQVLNWGTFNGLFDIPIAERGFLFVGRSGSGKSTLLDAMSALLVPPALVDFNAAAREAERSGRDRNLVSYVRGAWADQQDLESGTIATQYLRRGSTWSALALEYRNTLGECVTLVRLFWIGGAGNAAADVRRHYMVIERSFDVASELQGFDLDIRALKKRFGDEVQHFDGFAGYAERFRHLLGIGNEMALKLLHKTQSAKNLGDLNQFLRGFMLDEPETFVAAERLVADFAELDAAHRAVVTAREQIDTLTPARDAHRKLQDLRRDTAALREQQAGVDQFREQQRLRLIDARLLDIDAEHRAHGFADSERRERLANHEDRLADLERQRREQGGDRIDELERERQRVELARDERMRRRQQAEAACRQFEQSLAGSVQGFAEQVDAASRWLQAAGERATALDQRAAELAGDRREAEQRFRVVRDEIESLRRNASNIPAPAQALRARLCEALGIAENALPFVGELMQVAPEHAPWRGAIERVLHGFAQSLLVDERHHAAVAAWVNQTALAGKLVYYRVRAADQLVARAPDARSMIHKLELREHAHRGWLLQELAKRFDYACVDSIAALRQCPDRALTREGQVKHPGERYEKDDRRAIDDRRSWLLGFDNRDRQQLFEREAQQLAARIAGCSDELDAIARQREQGLARDRAAQTLVNLGWDDIDVAPKLARIGDIDAQLRAIRDGDSLLQTLGERIDAERTAVIAAREALHEIDGERRQREREHATLQREREAAAAQLQTLVLTPLQAEGLAARLAGQPALTLGNLESQFRVLERELAEQVSARLDDDIRLQQQILECFRSFRRRWPEDAADLVASLDGVDDFLARLRRLELDGLPKHEARFFELLQTQSKNNLLVLQKHIGEARKAIAQRLEEVNDSLESVPFNHGTLLTIELTDRRLPEVLEFQQQLREVLAQNQTEDRELAESQFTVLRSLVARLGGDQPELKRWRQQVLDVRQHVEFIGVELDAQTRVQLEIYRSGAGKSGGQRQKLATTCLAAALRYQLGGEDGALPRYAAVVLDEAFDKADNEFTALAMNIFENFGFQMIVATPLKSVMTLEPFIGGACFVEISGRHDSGVLLIEYDEANSRLQLPERARPQAVEA